MLTLRLTPQSRDILADISAWATKFGDSLANALVGVVVGAVTVAVTGNVIEGVKIAAAGVGKLIVDVMRTPPESRSIAGRTGYFFKRLFTSFMLFDAFIGITLIVFIVAIVQWGLSERNSVAANIDTVSDKFVSDSDANFQDRSKCRNKAVIVGINRWADNSTLAGCDRDGANMLRRVAATWGFPEAIITAAEKKYWLPKHDARGCYIRVMHGDSEIRVLRNSAATCESLQSSLEWLKSGVRQGDERLYYHSGHGTQTPSDIEADKLDECVVAYDHDWDNPKTWLVDDYIFLATNNLPNNSSFYVMLDTCNSAGFLRSATGNGLAQVRYLAPPANLVHGRTVQKSVSSDTYTNDNVLLLSGCTSDSVSYSDKYGEGAQQVTEGALTYNFLAEHKKTPLASMRELHTRIYATLSNSKFKQEPQLQGSERLKDKPFLIGA